MSQNDLAAKMGVDRSQVSRILGGKVNITEALPYAEEENEPDDPVEVFDHSISGGYINLALKLFKDPAANSAHPVSYYYTSNNNQDEFTFYVLHDGNHENPLYMDEKKLESQEVFFSIPLWNLLKKNTPTALKLCLYQLGKAEDGSYKVEKKRLMRKSMCLGVDIL